MARQASPRELVDALRDTLYPARPAEDFDYAKNVRELIRARTAFRSTRDHEADFAEAAIHLYNLCAAKRGEVALKAALGGLLQLGRPGWLLTRRLLLRQSLPAETCKLVLENLPASCGLGLFQELCRPPFRPEKSLLAWVEPLLEAFSQADIPELLHFLGKVDEANDQVSHPLRQALLTGPLNDWINGKLATRLSQDLFASLCVCARTLGMPETASELAALMARGKAPVSAHNVRMVSAAAAPGDAKAISALQGIIKSAGGETILACAAGLARLHWGNAGKLAALLQAKSPALATALPLLAGQYPEAAYRQYLAALHESERPRVHAEVFRGAARFQPAFATTRLKSAAELDAASRQRFKEMLGAEKKAGLAGLRLKSPPPPRNGPLQPEETKGFFSRLLPDKKTTLAELLEQVRNPRDQALPGSQLRETALTGRTLANLDISGGHFTSVQFIRSTFSGVDFSGSVLSEADLTGCTFTNCRFRGTHLHKSAMLSCQFNRCDFSGTIFTDCSVEECDIERSFFTACLLCATRMERTRLRGCAFGDCQFRDGTAVSVLLEDTSLTGNLWANSKIFGLLWRDCTLSYETFFNVRFQSSCMSNSRANQCRVVGSTTGIGPLDLLESERQEFLAMEMAGKALAGKTAPPPTPTPSQAAFLRRCADLWVRHRDVAVREAHMRRNNAQRLQWSEANMQGAQFLTIIPYLLSSQVFERAQNLAGTPNCRIAGYVPSLEALDLAEQHFPGLRSSSPAGEALVIECLATIGSVGSVAQTSASDADFWVCYDGATAAPGAIDGLKKKLDALSLWAEQAFGLEAHFFLMSLENVQNNDFGFSDKESSGTAQALMLKEEFYRTALIVAGRIPGWWLTPPGAEEKSYRAHLRAAVADPLADPGRFMDAGHASRIPPEEFFGAALWQIVKSIDSPFKSVLKLGLLEKYAREGGKGMLLCDQIKRDVTLNTGSPCETDPYAAMSAQVRGHYRDAKDREAVSLLTEALALKADVADMPRLLGRPYTKEHQALLSFLFGGDGTALPDAGRAERTFSRALALGDAVSRFMTTAYKRIRATQKNESGPAVIAPEDLTRLGRRISAIFAQRKHKVRRVPILGIGRGHFTELHFSAEKSPGKPTIWVAQGNAGTRGMTTSRRSEPLTRAADPVWMLAWLVINGLYSPQALVDAERSIAPLSTPDIRNVLDGLSEFMPPAEVFSVNPQEYLRDERITRAYLLPNFLAATDADKLVTLSVVYCTNWGEVFCLAPPSPAAALKLGAAAYLKKVLPQPQPVTPEIKAYYPKRSQCPRLKLA
jgi:adenylate cyclase class 1